VEFVHFCEPVAIDGLLNEVMEEVLDKGAVGVGRFDGESCEIAGALDSDLF
jgi:hypothetical protein